jgi:tight adherence protein C
VQLRAARKQIAQEKGMKSPVKMLIPMVAFIFPVLFIILLGPTVINMIHQFKM